MDNKTLKIGGSCGFGSLVGTLIALLISPWLCWVGALVGGLVAYIVYDLKQIIQAVPLAWKATAEEMKNADWYRFWRRVELAFYALVVGATSATLLTYLLYIVPPHHDSLREKLVFGGFDLFVSCLFAFVIYCNVLLGSESNVSSYKTRQGRKLALIVNPIVGPFALLAVLLWSSWWCLKRTPKPIAFLGKFSWKLFVLVHSEMRALCFLDSLLGTAIGTFYGYHNHTFALAAIVGAVSGASLGIIDYQFVSIRWLKLKSA